MAIYKDEYKVIRENILEGKFRILDNPYATLNDYLKQKDDIPSKWIKPIPGFCLKARDASKSKVFINFCHDEFITAPLDISIEELEKQLLSEEYHNYRVPLSIGEIRTDSDSKGNETVKICDVVCATSFYKKVEEHAKFKNFLINVVVEAMNEKYNIEIDVPSIIFLKNKKAFGKIPPHRIQCRFTDEKKELTDAEAPPSLFNDTKELPKKPMIETISSVEYEKITPEYRLYRMKESKNCLIGEFHFPYLTSASELSIDIGEDRIIIESTQEHNYFFDEFVPCCIRQDLCTSTFDKATRILTVKMPLMGG